MEVRCSTCQQTVPLMTVSTGGATTCTSCGSQLPQFAETAMPIPGDFRQIEHFTLLTQIGQGEFGVVWHAWDTQLQRPVAIKIARGGQWDPTVKQMFQSEAQAVAALRHPHIVPVHQIGTVNETPYVVSDLIQGPTLAEWAQRRRPSPQHAAQLCATIAAALHHAHEAGIIHRDLKPSNVLMDAQDQPHLTDFGLAKREGSEFTVAVDGQLLGTPAYMSPEQARGEAHRADRRTDVYSLGVLLYELLVGQRPFRGDTPALVHQILQVEPRPLRKLDKTLPRDLETICLKALEKDPTRRYATAQGMTQDLERYLAGEPIAARPVARWERGWRWARRNPKLAAASTTAVLTIVSLAGVALLAPWGTFKQAVSLETKPSGATVVFIPLHATTGEPQPERKIHAGISPVSLRIPPGDYLVEAYVDQERFHEVLRRVPGGSEELPGSYNHQRCKVVGRRIELPLVTIPGPTIRKGMAHVPACDTFVLSPSGELRCRHVPAFLIDPTEVTQRQWEQIVPGWNSGQGGTTASNLPNVAISKISYDLAAATAEQFGKRLPTHSEYESAATEQWTQVALPSNEASRNTGWPFEPVASDSLDCANFDPRVPVFGLRSNVAEWTTTRFLKRSKLETLGTMNVPQISGELPIVVCGTTEAVLNHIRGTAKAGRAIRTNSTSCACEPRSGPLELGLRCYRSVAPRLKIEDFVMDVP